MSIGLDRSCVAKRLVVLAVPTTPQLRDHQEIHHRKADKAGQEAFLNDTANQPPRIQHADHQLSKPDEPSEEQQWAEFRRRGRPPSWWANYSSAELEAMHRRGRQLVEGGYGSVDWRDVLGYK